MCLVRILHLGLISGLSPPSLTFACRQVFPEHRHIIVENCVWPLGLDTKGNQLEGTHADDVEPDLAAVRDDIMAALRHESIAAMSGLMDAGASHPLPSTLRCTLLLVWDAVALYRSTPCLHLLWGLSLLFLLL